MWLRKSEVDTQIHGRLEPQPGDIVVRKTCVGAHLITGTDLFDLIVIAGWPVAATDTATKVRT